MSTVFPLWHECSTSQNFWALIAFLFSLPPPLSLFRPRLLIFLFSPLLHICMLIKVGRVFPLWAGFSPGVSPGCSTWAGFLIWSKLHFFWLVLMQLLVCNKTLQSPDCGTNTVFHLFFLLRFQKCPSYLKCTIYLSVTHAGFMSCKTKWKHRVTFLAVV